MPIYFMDYYEGSGKKASCNKKFWNNHLKYLNNFKIIVIQVFFF